MTLDRLFPWLCFHTMGLWFDRVRWGGRVWSVMLESAGAEAYWDDPWCALNRRALAMEQRTGLLFDPQVMADLSSEKAA